MANGGSSGSSSPPKQVSGPTGHTTILMLEPYSYEIWLIYLGDKRVTGAPGYRCKFALHNNAEPNPANPDASPVRPLDPIPNTATFRKEPTFLNSPDDKASRCRSDGGDNQPPGGDQTYRVVSLDNHGLRDDDSNLLGSGANNKSKIDSYRQRQFEEDIVPDVPLRVI